MRSVDEETRIISLITIHRDQVGSLFLAGKRRLKLDVDTHNLSAREIELNERLKMAREKLAAKRAERQRLQKMEEELKELEAQLGED